MSGMKTTLVGVGGFVLFQFMYLSQLDPEFMTHIQEHALMGAYLNPFTICIYLAMEGIAAGLFASYISMRVVGMNETKHAGI